jgi:hypothetical protein
VYVEIDFRMYRPNTRRRIFPLVLRFSSPLAMFSIEEFITRRTQSRELQAKVRTQSDGRDELSNNRMEPTRFRFPRSSYRLGARLIRSR